MPYLFDKQPDAALRPGSGTWGIGAPRRRPPAVRARSLSRADVPAALHPPALPRPSGPRQVAARASSSGGGELCTRRVAAAAIARARVRPPRIARSTLARAASLAACAHQPSSCDRPSRPGNPSLALKQPPLKLDFDQLLIDIANKFEKSENKSERQAPRRAAVRRAAAFETRARAAAACWALLLPAWHRAYSSTPCKHQPCPQQSHAGAIVAWSAAAAFAIITAECEWRPAAAPRMRPPPPPRVRQPRQQRRCAWALPPCSLPRSPAASRCRPASCHTRLRPSLLC